MGVQGLANSLNLDYIRRSVMFTDSFDNRTERSKPVKKERTLEERFERGAAFAVPLHLVAPRMDALRAVFGKKLRPRAMVVDGLFHVDVCVFPGRMAGIKTRDRLFGSGGPFAGLGATIAIEAKDQVRVLPLILPAIAEVEFQDMDPQTADPKERIKERREMDVAAHAYMPSLALFARLSGWKVVWHGCVAESLLPYRTEPRVLHLVFGSVPPGDAGESVRQCAFGLYIEQQRRWLTHRLPARGRGHVVLDEDHEPAIQIVDQMAYILFPVVSFYHGIESEEIFRRMLAALNKTLREIDRGTLKPMGRASRPQDIRARMEQQVSLAPRYWKGRITEQEKKIEHLREQLALAYGALREVTLLAEGISGSERMQAAMARIPEDCKRIRQHPSVTAVYVCDDGLHVETDLIVIKHNGLNYPIGRFVIRFGVGGDLSLWAIEARSCLGASHPHCALGNPCFGTAGDAIARASGELRYADCVDMVLRWLSSYSPETATFPIEEGWTEEGVVLEHLEIKPWDPLQVTELPPEGGADVH